MRRIALLDTGAGCNCMSMKAAVQMLGMSQAEIEKIKPDDGASVVGGGKLVSYTVWRDIRLWHSVEGGDFIQINKARIRILPSILKDYSLLIGQISGFEEKVFRHSNRKKNRVWEIWAP
jgi:hypothetical protein